MAESFLHALAPLLRSHGELRDYVAVALRKAVFSRSVQGRVTAVKGFLTLLAGECAAPPPPAPTIPCVVQQSCAHPVSGVCPCAQARRRPAQRLLCSAWLSTCVGCCVAACLNRRRCALRCTRVCGRYQVSGPCSALCRHCWSTTPGSKSLRAPRMLGNVGPVLTALPAIVTGTSDL